MKKRPVLSAKPFIISEYPDKIFEGFALDSQNRSVTSASGVSRGFPATTGSIISGGGGLGGLSKLGGGKRNPNPRPPRLNSATQETNRPVTTKNPESIKRVPHDFKPNTHSQHCNLKLDFIQYLKQEFPCHQQRLFGKTNRTNILKLAYDADNGRDYRDLMLTCSKFQEKLLIKVDGLEKRALEVANSKVFTNNNSNSKILNPQSTAEIQSFSDIIGISNAKRHYEIKSNNSISSKSPHITPVTRYSSNKEWNRATAELVQATNTSASFISENSRFSGARYVDIQSKNEQARKEYRIKEKKYRNRVST